MLHVAGVSGLTIIDQLPMLTVVVPMLAAPLCVLIGNRHIAWLLAFLASVFSLLLQVMDGDILSYHMGGWAPPLGIEYRVDAANAFVLFLISGISTVILPYARQSGI